MTSQQTSPSSSTASASGGGRRRAQSLTLLQTTVGKKAVMAVSGLALVGFVIVHMIGNLQLYSGPEKINAYAALLHSMPAVLWMARLGLLAAVVAHIVAAVQLAGRNFDARSTPYQHSPKRLATNYAARTMYFSGPILLFFILYHLLHLTLGYTPNYRFDEHNVYNNIVLGFQQPLVAAVYIAGNLALAFHLYHGVWSMLQTLGAHHPRYNRALHSLARVIGLVVAVGNVSFPVSVLTGCVQPSDAIGADAAAADVRPAD